MLLVRAVFVVVVVVVAPAVVVVVVVVATMRKVVVVASALVLGGRIDQVVTSAVVVGSCPFEWLRRDMVGQSGLSCYELGPSERLHRMSAWSESQRGDVA